MNQELISKQNIEILANNAHPALRELLHATMLSSNYLELHDEKSPQRESTLYYVRLTPRTIYTGEKKSMEHITSSRMLNKAIEELSRLAPTLMRYSQDNQGNQLIPPYINKYNKRDVEKFYQFPVFISHQQPTKKAIKGTDDILNTLKFDLIKSSDVDNDPNGIYYDEWQIGRKRRVGVSTDNYMDNLTDNDYFDPAPLLNADWDAILTKKPVGRPRKPTDPFGRTNKASQQRASLKDVTERLERIEQRQKDIINHLGYSV